MVLELSDALSSYTSRIEWNMIGAITNDLLIRLAA
jgi:hypothetical protein